MGVRVAEVGGGAGRGVPPRGNATLRILLCTRLQVAHYLSSLDLPPETHTHAHTHRHTQSHTLTDIHRRASDGAP